MKEKKIEPKDKYLWTQRPEVQKVYTTKEVAELLDTSEAIVRGIVQYHHLDQSIVSTKSTRAAIYSYDTVRQIKEIHEARCKRINVNEQKRRLAELEEKEMTELEEQHPLVIDKRFLKLNYFPETVPSCFEE